MHREVKQMMSIVGRARGAAAAALACLLGLAACGTDATTDTVNVGLLLPFTGEVGAMGTNLEQAAIMVADEVNAHGGVMGKTLRLVTRDTHSDVARATESLDDLLANDVKAVVGPESAEVAVALFPILKQQRIPFISPYVSATLDSVDTDVPWFRLAPTPTSFGQALAKRMAADGVGQVVVVCTGDLYNATLADAAVTTFRQLGGQVIDRISLPAGLTDYSGQIMRQLVYGPAVVLLAADSMSGAGIVNDLSIVHPDADRRWYLSPSLKTSSFVRNTLPDKIEGAVGVAPSIVSTVKRFNDRFAGAWNGDAPLEGAYFYYDAMTLVALSLERAWAGSGKQTNFPYETMREAVREVARTRGISNEWDQIPRALDLIRAGTMVYYSGMSGAGPIIFDDKGERQLGTAAFWKVSGGEIVNL